MNALASRLQTVNALRGFDLRKGVHDPKGIVKGLQDKLAPIWAKYLRGLVGQLGLSEVCVLNGAYYEVQTPAGSCLKVRVEFPVQNPPVPPTSISITDLAQEISTHKGNFLEVDADWRIGDADLLAVLEESRNALEGAVSPLEGDADHYYKSVQGAHEKCAVGYRNRDPMLLFRNVTP